MANCDADERDMAQSMQASNRKGKSGGFGAMGLSRSTLLAIGKKGYVAPTPIQRRAIPVILAGNDCVAMARTGSGKSAAFLIPLVEKLRSHSMKVGARALILAPTRELAVQTLSFARALSKYNGLRSAAIVGGDAVDDQFSIMASNPDILIATPGRLLHLLIEMNWDLKTVEYLVFDEADQLFEMGFADTINEILHKMSADRQTLLFSATLPKQIVEFARAGLKNPVLVRLDADTKISPDLSLAFFALKADEKEAALLYLLEKVVKPDESTIVFTATKHHVEYLHELLTQLGYPASLIYGSLDQQARNMNMADFRAGKTKILLVTDLAARGIDIPYLNNVINYDFPDRPKLFVHRTGRAARAGRSGTAYSFITNDDVPHLLDLQLFFGKRLVLASNCDGADSNKDMIYGDVPAHLLQVPLEHITALSKNHSSLQALKKCSENGLKLYQRTKAQPSPESLHRSKEILIHSPRGSLQLGTHPLFSSEAIPKEQAEMIDAIRRFRPPETIFEIRKMGMTPGAAGLLMKSRREKVGGLLEKVRTQRVASSSSVLNSYSMPKADSSLSKALSNDQNEEETFQFRDADYFIPHASTVSHAEKGYAVDFQRSAADAQLDINGDDADGMKRTKNKLIWDKKKKKYTKLTIGSDNKKMIKTDSGRLVPASYKTDAFEKWQKKTKVDVKKPGEMEDETATRLAHAKKYRHNKVTAPKPLDKLHKNYEKILKKRKMKTQGEGAGEDVSVKIKRQKVKDEIRTVDQMKKEFRLKQKRREKNARPSKKRR